MSSRSLFHRFSAGLILLCGLTAAACGSDNSKLTVTGSDPNQGDVAGGTSVHIHGTRFTTEPHTVKVFFGDRPAQGVQLVSDTEIIAAAPGGNLNEVVNVRVYFEPGGNRTLTGAFRYIEKNKTAPSVDDLSTGPDRSRK